MRKILLVAVVLSLFVFPTSVGAQRFAPLNYCSTVEAHQESGLSTYEVNATGTGRYARLVEYPVTGGPVVVAGPHDFGSGATAYQFANVPLNPARSYQFQTSHTSLTTGYSTSGCILLPPPLAVVIEEFSAVCIPGGVRLAWAVNTEAFSTHYTVARDGDLVLDVPAACPGCTAGASYSRDVELPDAHGIYTLTVWNGAGLIDVEETWLATCEPPTAVRVSKFAAYGHRHPFNGWKVWRIEIMPRDDDDD